jgi:hypothetical protein
MFLRDRLQGCRAEAFGKPSGHVRLDGFASHGGSLGNGPDMRRYRRQQSVPRQCSAQGQQWAPLVTTRPEPAHTAKDQLLRADPVQIGQVTPGQRPGAAGALAEAVQLHHRVPVVRLASLLRADVEQEAKLGQHDGAGRVGAPGGGLEPQIWERHEHESGLRFVAPRGA